MKKWLIVGIIECLIILALAPFAMFVGMLAGVIDLARIKLGLLPLFGEKENG